MQCCQNLWFLLFFALSWKSHPSVAKPFNESAAKSIELTSPLSELITQDIIQDKVEMDVKKVIRINPLELPAFKVDTDVSTTDSSLYKIQNLQPHKGQRKYVQLQRSTPFNEVTSNANYPAGSTSRLFSLLPSPDKTSKAKHQAKKKNLHFLYNQNDLAGNLLSKSVPVHVATGAYPVYYVIAKTNGRFGKHPLKSFGSAQDFKKYLQKNKIESPIPLRSIEESV